MNGLNLSGPGILWTASKIRKPDLLDWGTFLKWYEGDLIPRCMALSGFNTALRATSRDHSDERPNLVILTLDDLAFFDTDEFKTIPDYSEILPGSGKFWEVVDFENRWYSLLSVFDHKKEPLSTAKCIIVTGWDIRGDLSEEALDSWYLNQHNEQMTHVPGFLRSTRFKLEHDWWSAGDGASLTCPDWLEICEFDVLDIDLGSILEQKDTQIQAEILSKCTFEFGVYKMERTWGDDEFFHGLQMKPGQGRPSVDVTLPGQ